jgi:hypothetical protein
MPIRFVWQNCKTYFIDSLYAIVDNFDCFPCISLHQYEIILTLISISSGYLPNSPYTIKLGVDTFRRNKSLQNYKHL